MNREIIAHKLFLACEILQCQRFAVQRDTEYPTTSDFVDITQAKSLINDVELLLKHDESNQPQPPISQTPMLGEVPPVGHSNISESSQAVEGETRLETKEVKKAIPFGIAMLRAKQHYRNTEDDNIPF